MLRGVVGDGAEAALMRLDGVDELAVLEGPDAELAVLAAREHVGIVVGEHALDGVHLVLVALVALIR